jgi:hypothetical protein
MAGPGIRVVILVAGIWGASLLLTVIDLDARDGYGGRGLRLRTGFDGFGLLLEVLLQLSYGRILVLLNSRVDFLVAIPPVRAQNLTKADGSSALDVPSHTWVPHVIVHHALAEELRLPQ